MEVGIIGCYCFMVYVKRVDWIGLIVRIIGFWNFIFEGMLWNILMLYWEVIMEEIDFVFICIKFFDKL